MKRLLYIPLNYHQNSHPALLSAFKLYFNCEQFTTLQAANEFNPHYVYVQSGAIHPQLLQYVKIQTNAKIIQWTGDCRREPLSEVLAYKDICDLTLLACAIGQQDMYAPLLPHPVKYWQHAVNQSQFRTVQTELKQKHIRFIGNSYAHFDGAVERDLLCKKLTAEFPLFEVWGNGYATGEYRNPDSIPFPKIFDKYNQTYISLSSNIFNDIEGYWSNRPLTIMAAGSCCLMRYTPNAENWFTDMEHCVFYKTEEEAIDKINYLLAHPDVRNKIAQQGQLLVQEKHTYNYRAHEFKQLLNTI